VPTPPRLALIEDHAALRQGLELLLGLQGCDVVASAGDREGGLQLVREHEPDVIVVDVGLGEHSGITLTRDLLAEDPDRRVVLYTGSTDADLLLDGLDSGARGYALKEGTPGELMDAIRVVAEGGTYVDPRLRPSLLSQRATQRTRSLSARERQITQLLAEGLTGEEVAERLVLSSETVKTHIRNAMAKLEARNRVHAIAIALRSGVISLDGDRVALR
jgi:DNA-binding NarL/FixJ family response regulator